MSYPHTSRPFHCREVCFFCITPLCLAHTAPLIEAFSPRSRRGDDLQVDDFDLHGSLDWKLEKKKGEGMATFAEQTGTQLCIGAIVQ